MTGDACWRIVGSKVCALERGHEGTHEGSAARTVNLPREEVSQVLLRARRSVHHEPNCRQVASIRHMHRGEDCDESHPCDCGFDEAVKAYAAIESLARRLRAGE